MDNAAVDLASSVYLALLSHPHDKWRTQNQAVYCALRDFIAHETGRDAEDVQNGYEGLAREAD